MSANAPPLGRSPGPNDREAGTQSARPARRRRHILPHPACLTHSRLYVIYSQRVMIQCRNAHDVLFRTLADPTRRAIFEAAVPRRRAEQAGPDGRAGVSQAGRVKAPRSSKAGRVVREATKAPDDNTARTGALPVIDWDKPDDRVLEERSTTSKDLPQKA